MGCPVSRQCAVACRASESSQHPMCPHAAQRRRCTHQPPPASHSTQPVPLGGTAGSTAVLMHASLPVAEPVSGKTLNQADSIKMSETKCVGVTSQLWYLTVSFAVSDGLTANHWSLTVRLKLDDDWTACGICRRVPLVVMRVRRSAIGVTPVPQSLGSQL
jgi:hypothetical protein